MKRILLLTACAIAFTGCGRSPQVDEKNASVAEVARALRDSGAGDSFVRPGLWQSKVTIEALDVPGMPPEAARQMKANMAKYQQQDFRTCLTKEEASRPKEDFFTGKAEGCRYDHFTMGGGKIDAAMNCTDPQGGRQLMQMAGSYSPDSYNMHMAMKHEGAPGSAGGLSMQMRVDARRVGECTGKEPG